MTELSDKTNEPPDPNPEPAASSAGQGEAGIRKQSRAVRRAQAASDVLRTFIRDLYVSRFGAVPTKGQDVDITVRLRIRPLDDWALEFDPPLVEQILPQIEDAQAGWDVLCQGRVYCFRCDSSDCEHAVPESALSVFQGYAPNGVAEWRELAQVLVEAKDDRVDRLFGRNPAAPVALVQLGHDLRVRQLSSFGRSSKTYSILGQVVSGYYSVRSGSGEPQRIAVTLQVVEARDEHGRSRLQLNTLALFPDGSSVSDAFGSGWEPGLHRAREGAIRELKSIEQRVLTGREQRDNEAVRIAMRGVPGVLRRLAESIEQSGRQRIRRTNHVEERRKDRRPVHKALEDLHRAQNENLFFDEKGETMIACGPQNRAHAFNPDGRHVTSFVLHPGAVEFRLRTRRWRRVTADEASHFRETVEGFIPQNRQATGESPT